MKELLLIDRVKMNKPYLIEKVKKFGFDTLEDFIKANLHYLSEIKQKQFYLISETTSKENSKPK